MTEPFERPAEDVAEQRAPVGGEDETEHNGEHFETDPADAWDQEEVVSLDGNEEPQ